MSFLTQERVSVSEGIDLHIDAIQTWSRLEAKSSVDAGDLAQQAVLALLIAKQQKRGPMSRAYAMIRAQGAMRNVAANQYLFEERHQTISNKEHQAEDSSSSDTVAQMAQARELLRSCMDRLGEREREIIRLRYIENKSNAEVAVILGMTESHVTKTHGAALEHMRGMLSARRIYSSQCVI